MRFNVAVLLLGLFVGRKLEGQRLHLESRRPEGQTAPGGLNAPEGSKLETAPKSSGGATTLAMWDVVSHIEAWMKEKGNAIEEAYALKVVRSANNFADMVPQGGWEGWAQVELALFFQKQKDFEGATISREDHVYEGTLRRDDLLIKKPSFTTMVELKCESKGNQDGFVIIKV
ncbi:hypothetical protein BT96DRAFT_1024443 [Gymnopus androsaceus JB14]|uniref:Uncharacterized protein n=1 Tax=Gymnopus androsaceus JB14 TaxID=1447944 RepID=A0A6A4GZU2_9AGAR|nr:hypothetical protein BT96DRAFT_1024443 [Gymnopus androsaceus JB14]